ncbi:MAG: iron-sulfur cluster-binding protein, partial [Anaerolineae bacterium]|nr:iron-sulfur cluster-binding protein [Anaerolineae bacterium]
DFRADAKAALANPHLQSALAGATNNFRTGRLTRLAELPDPDALRDQLKTIRSSTLANLAAYLEQFERNAQAAGSIVHWARDGAEAQQIVIEIARQHGAAMAVKAKSMATEEIHLGPALEKAGIAPIETDLGEYIVQIAGEPPSHLVGPALHKTRQQIAELFSAQVGRELDPDDISTLVGEARTLLRDKFLEAGVGISGANIGVAETGSLVLVTNEGNGRMVTSLPPVHIAVVGIEKICPTWGDAAVWLSLLARSATGQQLSVYTNAITGPARADDPDGPQEVHIILLDNGRSKLIGTQYEEVLQCIRCGSCLNACPVYQNVGGHTYNHPYSGPIGAVLVPLLNSLEDYEALPHASSLCNACLEVCPSRIDLPRMLLELRAEEAKTDVIPLPEQVIEKSIAWLLGHRRLWNFALDMGRIFQTPLVDHNHLRVPEAINPAGERQLPCLAPRAFHDLWDDLREDDDEAAPQDDDLVIAFTPEQIMKLIGLVVMFLVFRKLFSQKGK